jgi:hypothetical protein
MGEKIIMAKSKKKSVTKTAAPAATKSAAPLAKAAVAKGRAPRVRTGVADDIRAFLKQAGNPVTLAQLNAALSKSHSAASIYAALQYMGRRNEISRKGRGKKAMYGVKSSASAAPAAAVPHKRRGRKPTAAGAAPASGASNFSSMIAELKRVADSAERTILHQALKSTDHAIRAMAEMAAEMRARAAKFSLG